MEKYTVGIDAGWTVAISGEDMGSAQAMASLREERHECADQRVVLDGARREVRECDGCYAALGHESYGGSGLWLCDGCRS